MAANEGRQNVVEFLLEKGCKVDSMGTWRIGLVDITSQITPLWAAALGGNLNIVKLLVDRGADINFRVAKDKGSISAIGGTILHAAAWGGNADVAKYLISVGVNVDAAGNMPTGQPFTLPNKQVTPLFVAAQWGNKEIVELLIRKGANINARNTNGYTPLDRAANDQIVTILKKYGGKNGKSDN